MIRILLVDDQNLVQQGIKSLLEQDQNFKVIGTVEDGKSAIKQISLLRPDIVLLDIEMPGMNGITVTKYINHFLPETKVIILSSHEEKKYLVQSLVAGARSYILKSSLMQDLKQAILAVDNGYSLIESRLLARVLNSGTVKLVPIKSETIQNTSKQKKGESARLVEQEYDESDLLLIHKNQTAKDSADKLWKDNLADVPKNPVLVQSEATQTKEKVTKKVFHEQRDQVNQLKDQSINLNDTSNITKEDNSDYTSLILDTEENILDTSTSEQKNKILLDSKNNSLEPKIQVDKSLSDKTKMQAFKQNANTYPPYNLHGDESSYPTQISINKVGLDKIKTEDKSTLIPVGLSQKSSDNSNIIFGSNIARSKINNVVAKSSLDKIKNHSEIRRIKVVIVRIFQPIFSILSLYFAQFIKPILSKYKPFFNHRKSGFFKLRSKRNTQQTLLNLGLMILGVIIVLLVYSL